jgi:hypothetical protein
MILTELIREQAFQCAVMAGAGVVIMTAYRVFRNTCGLIKPQNKLAAVMEITFWILAAVVTSYFLYYCAYGRLSVHAAVSFAAGAILWKKMFCDIIDRIYMKLNIIQGIYNRYGEKEKKQSVQGHQPGDRH